VGASEIACSKRDPGVVLACNDDPMSRSIDILNKTTPGDDIIVFSDLAY